MIREGIFKALHLPNTGMAVTIDIGEHSSHPSNKYDVGKRLALWALAKVYGQDNIPSGPLYTSYKIKNRTIEVSFDHIAEGMFANGDHLQGFAIAGKDKKWVNANAVIKGNLILVSSPEVYDPVAVRYAWADNPICNLYNAAGLPASPFRTDDW